MKTMWMVGLLLLGSMGLQAADGDGVTFFEGSFRQALAKAKKEKKPLPSKVLLAKHFLILQKISQRPQPHNSLLIKLE